MFNALIADVATPIMGLSSAILGCFALGFLLHARRRFAGRSHTGMVLAAVGLALYLAAMLFTGWTYTLTESGVHGRIALTSYPLLGLVGHAVGILLIALGAHRTHREARRMSVREFSDLRDALHWVRWSWIVLSVGSALTIAFVLFATPSPAYGLFVDSVGFFLLTIGTYKLREVKLGILNELTLIAGFVIVVVVGATLGETFSNRLEQATLNQQATLTTQVAQGQAELLVSEDAFVAGNADAYADELDAYARSIRTPDTIDLTVWSVEGTAQVTERSAAERERVILRDDDFRAALHGLPTGRIESVDTEHRLNGIQVAEVVHVFAPIRTAETETVVAVVDVSIDVAVIEETLFWSRFMTWGLISGLILTLVAVTILNLVILRRVVTRPVRDLTEAAKRVHLVAGHETHMRVPYLSDDEIGELARAFNTLLDEMDELRGKRHR